MKKFIVSLLLLATGISLLGSVHVVAGSSNSEERGAPLASFHLISDVHVNAGLEKYKSALQVMKGINEDTTIAFVNTGDFTDYASQGEYDNFYNATKANNPVSNEETIIILGNHDVRGGSSDRVKDPTDPQIGKTKMLYWETAKNLYKTRNKDYMPEEAQKTLYHAKELGGYTFIALNTELGLKDSMYMSKEQIKWFEQTMKEAYEKDPTKPIFIFNHQPLNDTHWWSNGLDGFDGINQDGSPKSYNTGADAAVKEILAKYPNGIFMSGHEHNNFGQAEGIVRPYAWLIDIPAFGKAGSTGGGYEVEIYENEVVFRAVIFSTGEWLPQYDITVPTGENCIPAIYQMSKKKMEINPALRVPVATETFDELDALLNRKYDQTDLNKRGNQYYYQKADHNKINSTAQLLKALIQPTLGETITFQTNELNLQLHTNATAELTAFLGADILDNQYIEWSSSDEKIATVVDGKITALSAGQIIITATSRYDKTVKAECTVNVTDPTGDVEASANDHDSDTVEKDGGCGSVVMGSMATVGIITAVAALALKKKTISGYDTIE